MISGCFEIPEGGQGGWRVAGVFPDGGRWVALAAGSRDAWGGGGDSFAPVMKVESRRRFPRVSFRPQTRFLPSLVIYRVPLFSLFLFFSFSLFLLFLSFSGFRVSLCIHPPVRLALGFGIASISAPDREIALVGLCRGRWSALVSPVSPVAPVAPPPALSAFRNQISDYCQMIKSATVSAHEILFPRIFLEVRWPNYLSFSPEEPVQPQPKWTKNKSHQRSALIDRPSSYQSRKRENQIPEMNSIILCVELGLECHR